MSRRNQKKKDVVWVKLSHEEAVDEVKDFVDNWAEDPDSLLALYKMVVDSSARIVWDADGNEYHIEYAHEAMWPETAARSIA